MSGKAQTKKRIDQDTFLLVSWFDSSEEGTLFFLISEKELNEILTEKKIGRLIEYGKTKQRAHDCSLGDEETFAKHNRPKDPEDLLQYRVGKILRALKPHMREINLREIVSLGQSIKTVVEYHAVY